MKKKNVFKSIVAIIALIAMLVENTYSAAASMLGVEGCFLRSRI